MAAESREIFWIHKLFMADHGKLRIAQIQPLGNVTAGDKIDMVYPWGKFLYPSEPVLQVIPVTVAAGASCLFIRAVFSSLAEPCLI